MTDTATTKKTIRRNRLKILLIPAIFAASFGAALVAALVGWQPGTYSHGQPILPQRSFKDIRIVMDNGSAWPWRDPTKPRMTLVALSNGPCQKECTRLLILLRNARITLNEHEDRLRLLYLGQVPAGVPGNVLMKSWHHGDDVANALATFRPTKPDQVSAILVEANGTALVSYPVGFSPDGVKDDLHKVIQ